MPTAHATRAEPTATEDAGPARHLAPHPATALPLTAALIVLALSYWTVDIVSPALPAISDSLGVSATGAGLIVAAFFGGRLVSNLPAAALTDRAGPRLTAAVGALVLGLGSIVAAFAHAETPFLVARALQGCGVALLATAGLLSVLRALPRGGAAMTAFNVSAGVGGSFGLYSSGWLTGSFGWRAIFWFSAALATIVFITTLVSHSIAARQRSPRPDLGRAVTAAPSPPSPLFGKMAIGAMLANLLVYANYAIWVVGLPLYAAVRFGAGTADIALLLLIINIIHLLGAFPVGGVIRLFGAQATMALGFASAALGIGATILAPNERWLLVPMALYAFGQVAGNSGSGDLLLRLGGDTGRGVAMVRLTSDIGMVVGPAAAGALVDAAGVTAPFIALAAISGIAAVASGAAARHALRPV
ncbi:MAG: MFS transporter [Thermomicrobiales bacterium]|nr:MFS transporter [Thermomicrobiales bacterium]